MNSARTGPDLAANATDGQSLGAGAPPGLGLIAIVSVMAGCSHAPTMNLFGSYFPAWMLCAAIGVVAAVIVWRILALTGIHEYVVAPLLTYAGLALSATLLTWLLWFGR